MDPGEGTKAISAAPTQDAKAVPVPTAPVRARGRGRPKGSGKLTESARRERRRVNNRKAAQRSTAKKLDRQERLERDNLEIRKEIELAKRHLLIHQHLTSTDGRIDLAHQIQSWSQPRSLLAPSQQPGPEKSGATAATTNGGLQERGGAEWKSLGPGIKKARLCVDGFLKTVSVFKDMTQKQRIKVAQALTPTWFKKGTRIITQGQAGNTFYLIADGTVVITVERQTTALTMSRGRFFGEMTLIDNTPPSASVSALTAVECLTLTRSQFSLLFPDVQQSMKQVLTTKPSQVSVAGAAAAVPGVSLTVPAGSGRLMPRWNDRSALHGSDGRRWGIGAAASVKSSSSFAARQHELEKSADAGAVERLAFTPTHPETSTPMLYPADVPGANRNASDLAKPQMMQRIMSAESLLELQAGNPRGPAVNTVATGQQDRPAESAMTASVSNANSVRANKQVRFLECTRCALLTGSVPV